MEMEQVHSLDDQSSMITLTASFRRLQRSHGLASLQGWAQSLGLGMILGECETLHHPALLNVVF